MKKVSAFLLVLLASVFYAAAYDSYGLIGLSLGRVGVSAEIGDVNADSGYTDIGLHLNAAIYGEGRSVGFFISDTLNFINFGDGSSKVSNTTYDVETTSFGMNMSLLLGVALKPNQTPTDLCSFRFSPCIALGTEFEVGKVRAYSTEISYSYMGWLFGLGLDMQWTIISTGRVSFGIGANAAWYPFYAPSFKINDNSFDIDFDNYNRFTLNLFLGVTIRNGSSYDVPLARSKWSQF